MAGFQVKRKGLLHRLAEVSESKPIPYDNEEACKKIGKNTVNNPEVYPDLFRDLNNMFRLPLSTAVGNFRSSASSSDYEYYKKQVKNMLKCRRSAFQKLGEELKISQEDMDKKIKELEEEVHFFEDKELKIRFKLD